jgi:hypothetical protein
MGKYRRKAEPGTWLERAMFESPAWLALNGTEKSILVFLLGKRSFHKQTLRCLNCDNLTLTYTELQRKYGISSDRTAKAIDGLLATGFIEIRHHGGLGKHSKTIYALSDNWRNWETGRGIIFGRRKKKNRQGFRGGKFGALRNQKPLSEE